MRAAVLALSAIALVSCSSGGGGDLDHVQPKSHAFGTPIADANAPADDKGARDPARAIATLCGSQCPGGAAGATCPKTCPNLVASGVVVTAVDSFDETLDGKSIGNIYVQDAVQPEPLGTPYSGITLFQPISNAILQPGDGVDLTGAYQPFPGPASSPFPVLLPEVSKGAISLSYEGRQPAPIDVDPSMFKDAKQGMAFVGRLVRLKNVAVGGAFDPKRHEATISTDGTLSIASQFFLLDDPKGLAAGPGTKFAAVTGVITYFFNFKLCPRSTADIVSL